MTDEELASIDPVNTPTADEFALLTGFLDYQRAVMRRKARDLTRDQLAVRVGPSDLTIGGLIKHLAWAEDIWFDRRVAGNEVGDVWSQADWDADPDWEIHSAADDEPEYLLRLYDEACQRGRVAVDGADDLDAVSKIANGRGQHFSLRWILLHMIEETARHAGHADLIRESIDGVTGD